MQNFVLSLEGQFPSIYSQGKSSNTNSLSLTGGNSGLPSGHSSHSSSISSLSAGSTSGSTIASSTNNNNNTASTVSSSTANPTGSEEILPNKLPLKRRLAEFRFGRDGGTLSIGKKHVSTFTTNPFAFDKFKDIVTAFTVHLHVDGVILDPGAVGPLPYSHPTILHLLNSINTGTLPLELFLTLLEQSQHMTQQQSLFYDGCVVVGVVEWRPGMTLTIGNVVSGGSGATQRPLSSALNNHSVQWTRRVSNVTNQSNSSPTNPEMHKVLLKPTPDCWQYALSFMAASSASDGEKFTRILEDEDRLLEFERQLILINEPIVCLDPSPMVMYAMNALHFDRQKHFLFEPLKPSEPTNTTIYDEFDQTLLNFAALKPHRTDQQQQASPPPPAAVSSYSNLNPRFRRISLIESIQDRERRRSTEPIYGIDHRRQFVKNRQPLPPSSFVPANWRPFKTIRYEREISSSARETNSRESTISATPFGSLAKLYYCVNVFYAPPPVYPPIQLFLQVGTSPDTSTSGFLHRLQFLNLLETENYLQNLRNLLLIENGNCNLKVVTDISTTTASTTTSTAAGAGGNTVGAGNSSAMANVMRKQLQGNASVNQGTQGMHSVQGTQSLNQNTQSSQSTQNTQTPQSLQSLQSTPSIQQQYQLTPHQILQLNQQRSSTSTTVPKDNTINPNQINKQF